MEEVARTPKGQELAQFRQNLGYADATRGKHTPSGHGGHGQTGWLGALGALLLIVILPAIPVSLYLFCHHGDCINLKFWDEHSFLTMKRYPWQLTNDYVSLFFNAEALGWYCGWFALHTVLYVILPSKGAWGVPLNKQGHRLHYETNGLAALFVSIAVAVALVYFQVISPTYLYDHFLHLMTSAFLVVLVMSVLLYATSVHFYPSPSEAPELAEPGNTGSAVMDCWMGRTKNPRLGKVDMKYMCELRPGLSLWALFIISFAYKQYLDTGSVSPSMAIVVIAQTYYVVDALWFEPAILTTMDITTEGFGYMLAFGDLVWVPFNYSMQARYLVDHHVSLAQWELAAIVCLAILGMIIFRLSNLQKNEFRSNPNAPSVKRMQYITTAQGSKLLTSGWWGMARHINYTADLTMGIAWCWVCGCQDILPWWYQIYFTILLVHREVRDEAKCALKYGADWEKYCKLVPYRFIPYVI